LSLMNLIKSRLKKNISRKLGKRLVNEYKLKAIDFIISKAINITEGC